MLKPKQGFSLLEMIIVVAVVAVFAAWFLVASKPAKRIGEAADIQRQYDVESIEKAIKLIATDDGSLTTDLTSLTNNTPYMIVKPGGSTVGTYTCTALGSDISKADISGAIATVMPSLPVDPDLAESSNDTGYYIVRNGTNYNVETCDSYYLAATIGNKQQCGDGYCGNTESCSSCSQDCGECAQQQQSYTVGPYYPGTGSDDGGPFYIWGTPTNILLDDGNYTQLSGLLTPGMFSDTVAKLIKANGDYATENKAIYTPWPASWSEVIYGDETSLWGETWTPADINDPDFGFGISCNDGNENTSNVLRASNFGFNIPLTATITGIKVGVDKYNYVTTKPTNSIARIDFIRITVYYED